MTVSTIANLASGVAQRSKNVDDTKFSNSVKALIASGASSSNAGSDIAPLSDAVARNTQTAGLRAVSLNIAQASSALDVAAGGATEVKQLLNKLQPLAVRGAFEDLSDTDRASLNAEFSNISSQLNDTVETSRFNNKALLDGTLTLSDIGLAPDANNEAVGIPNLTVEALFGGDGVSIVTPDAASRALTAITAAQTQAKDAIASISRFQTTLEFGNATIDSASANQDAARSNFANDNVENQSSNTQYRVANESAQSLLAQTTRLPANLLQLLAE